MLSWWSHGEGVRRGGLFPAVLGKYSSELDIYTALLVHRTLGIEPAQT